MAGIVFLVAGLALLGAGCATRFEDRPLQPEQSAASWQGRSLSDPALRDFVTNHSNLALVDWPPASWDLSTLTLVAFYFHPSLEIARAQWRVAEAAVITAGGRPNPTIGVTPEYSVNPSSGVSPWLATVNLDWPIETAGKRDHRIAAARHLAESARWQWAEQAWAVRSQLRSSLVEFLAGRQREALLASQIEAQVALGRMLEQRLEAGLIGRQELTSARLAWNKTSLELADARRQLVEQHGQLAAALGLPVAALEGCRFAFDLADSANGEPKTNLDSNEARRVALRSRPDVLAALAEYAASQSALQLEIAKQYPDVHLGTGYQFDQGESKWSVGLSLEVPVLNRNEGPIAEAEARRAESAARFNALQTRVIADLDRALSLQSVTHAQVEASAAVLQTQEWTMDSLEAALAAGGADQLEVQTARVEWRALELSRLEGLVRMQEALGLLEDALQQPWEAMRTLGPFQPSPSDQTNR